MRRLFGLLALCVSCGGGGSSDDEGTFEVTACPVTFPTQYQARCGFATMDDGTRLAVAIVRGSASPAGPPTFYLEGGPGGAAIENSVAASVFRFAELLELGDVVLVDQRATGASEPHLDCKERSSLSPTDKTGKLAWLKSCSQSLKGSHPERVNTRQIAADIEQVRRILGYSTMNLYGISYGTRLALTIVRDFPGSVRSIAIDGVLPLQIDLLGNQASNLQRSFQALFDACRSDATCALNYGDLETQLFAKTNELNTNPALLDVGGVQLALTGDIVISIMFQLLYIADALPIFPALIQATAQGDYSLYEAFFQAAASASGEAALSPHMNAVVLAQDEAPFTSAARIEESQATVRPEITRVIDGVQHLRELEAWELPPSPASENEPVQSPIPALVVSGAFDPVTPPSYASLAAQTLSNKQEFTLSDGAHGSTVAGCGLALLKQFLRTPDKPIADPCVNAMNRLSFRPLSLPVASDAAPAIYFEPERRAALARLHRLLDSDQFRQGLRLRGLGTSLTQWLEHAKHRD